MDIGYSIIIAASIITLPIFILIFMFYKINRRAQSLIHIMPKLFILYRLFSSTIFNKEVDENINNAATYKNNKDEILITFDEDDIDYRKQKGGETDEDYLIYLNSLKEIANNKLFFKNVLIGVARRYNPSNNFIYNVQKEIDNIDFGSFAEILQKNISIKNMLLLRILKIFLIYDDSNII